MSRTRREITLSSLLLIAAATIGFGFAPQGKDAAREEVDDYFKTWLDRDVVWIITDEERSVFLKLTTEEERNQFIEQFWRRRDPDPRTAANEFKEEHYRRLAYVNEQFTSGAPGWKTDRGRIYIIHGPPDQIEKHTYGQSYERPLHEGGGRTATLPFELWWYREIEGLGSDIELEFVDPTGSGEFRLARNPWEKDALILSPGSAPTLAEADGLATRAEHPMFQPDNLDNYPFMEQRVKDNPFIRYETQAMVQAAPVVKYKDLKELVEVDVRFDSLPLLVRKDYFQINERLALVPVTIELQNRNLSFSVEGDLQVARIAVYGIVTSMTNRFVTEFEDDFHLAYRPEDFEQALLNRSVFQKTLSLPADMRYRLDLVVRDLKSESTGVLRQGIIPPRFTEGSLGASTMILSDAATRLPTIPEKDEMFVIGDIKIRPNLARSFKPERPLWIYFHLYNARLDQSTGSPSLSLRYQVLREGKEVASLLEQTGQSIQFVSDRRAVLLRGLSIKDLQPGRYQLRVEVTDRLSGQRLVKEDSFSVEG